MRSYLVVMDETEEAQAALRYAARRAARTGGVVEILALIPQQEFSQWGAVQAAMEEEARLRAEAMLVQASGAIAEEAGIKPSKAARNSSPAGRGCPIRSPRSATRQPHLMSSSNIDWATVGLP